MELDAYNIFREIVFYDTLLVMAFGLLLLLRFKVTESDNDTKVKKKPASARDQ